MKIYQDSFGNIIGENGYPINWDILIEHKLHCSYFKGGITQTTPYKTVTPPLIYKAITGEYYKKQTQQYRKTLDPNIKRSMDYATFSAVCLKRSEKGVISHSGMICLDFDHISNVEQTKKLLLEDKQLNTLLLFTSPSGDGLKWVVEIDISSEHHLTYFVAISNYMKHTYGLEVDKACKDISRACFIPYDPNCYINTKFFQL